jgi:acyl carrier protein
MAQVVGEHSALAIREAVRGAARAALRKSDHALDALAPLTTLGMDSIMAAELSGLLADRFDLDLPATVAFEYPTVEALSARVLRLLREQGGGGAEAPPYDSPARGGAEAPPYGRRFGRTSIGGRRRPRQR